ncbi:MAG: DoxX family protein [Chitinophagaceae bacterium]|nr:DoxX family protein [Chitinophagaceae bacterium]
MGKRKMFSLYSMAAFYVLAGVNHFANPDFYKKIMPPWLPWHYSLIFISGVAEIVLGLLLLPVQTRKLAACGIIVLLVAILPANVQMMLNYQQQKNPYLWIAVVRLPLQLLFIGWAYQFAKSDRK